MALTVVVFLPLFAALLCWLAPFRKAAWAITVACLSLTCVLALVVTAKVISNGRVTGIARWIELDGLGALILALVTLVCLLAAIFAGGYMRREHSGKNHLWWFYCNYNLFVFALVAVPSLADPNLVWVAVELVTLFSVLLVAFENTAGALEAAWKFAVLTIMGAPIALLGFLTLFWAYHTSGAGAAETWESLRAMAPMMPPQMVKFSFLLVFVGFGAKSGLAPMHTWLPDAHSQAPSPICAVMSGIKTTVPLYVILRLLAIVMASPVAHMGGWLVVVGLLSVGIAAFLLIQVRDYKRMFAYSTVEHMGIILTAAGFATQSADFGAVAQILNHAITKSLCFYVAGTILLAVGTREIRQVRGLFRLSPFAGGTLLLCALAITGAPPFPIFLSEFSILAAGVRSGHNYAVAILAILIVVAFVAVMLQVNSMLFGKCPSEITVASLPLSCRAAVLAAAVPVIVLGVFIPAPVYSLLHLAAQQLGGH